jgi:ribokinase
MGRVLVIGSVNTDLVCRAPTLPRAGETLRGSSFAVFAGGKGANQAVAAARAGAEVVFVGAVGDDDFGAARRADLLADGINVARLRTLLGTPSGVALIVVDDAGANQIVMVPGANDAVSVQDALDALATEPYAALSLTLEAPLDVVAAALEQRPAGVSAVLNVAPYDARVAPLLPLVDVLVCNELEAGELLGAPLGDDAQAGARALLQLGPRVAIVTLGARGAAVATADEDWLRPAPRVTAVDTTGAGDAFCGALTAWLADGATLRSALTAGVAAGALSVTRAGAQPSLPRRAELDALLGDAQP